MGALKYHGTPRVIIVLRKSLAVVGLYPYEVQSVRLLDVTS